MSHGLNMHTRCGPGWVLSLFSIQSRLSVLVSINLSTHSVCSCGNQDTSINLQHFQWEMGAGCTCFSCSCSSLYIITFLFSFCLTETVSWLLFKTNYPLFSCKPVYFHFERWTIASLLVDINVSHFTAVRLFICCYKKAENTLFLKTPHECNH